MQVPGTDWGTVLFIALFTFVHRDTTATLNKKAT